MSVSMSWNAAYTLLRPASLVLNYYTRFRRCVLKEIFVCLARSFAETLIIQLAYIEAACVCAFYFSLPQKFLPAYRNVSS